MKKVITIILISGCQLHIPNIPFKYLNQLQTWSIETSALGCQYKYTLARKAYD